MVSLQDTLGYLLALEFPSKICENGSLIKFKRKFSIGLIRFLSMAGRIQVSINIIIASHVYISSYWLLSKDCYNQLTQLIRNFILSKWGNKKGTLLTSWIHCIQLKDKGGLGILDPYIQDIFLTTKWIVRSLDGNAPWKHLICHPIQTATTGHSWVLANWSDKLLLAPYFKLHGSAPLNSIWKSW